MQLLVRAASASLAATMAVSLSTTAVPAAGSSPTAARSSPAAARSSPAAAGTIRGAQTTGADSAAAIRSTTALTPLASSRVSLGLAFTWPLSPRPEVHRPFEQPLHEWSRGHRGVDLLAALGQPVLSAGQGVVAFSGVVAGRGVITVRHSGGLRTTYEPVDDRLESGALVARGARIGVVSPTPGHCAPLTCLHWGAISGRRYRDPLTLLGFGPPILLPLS
jgi:murein DD-endopeptidase MepM/ murein hydrolase activator NlpD